jgi:PDZ domain-containing secreted protein
METVDILKLAFNPTGFIIEQMMNRNVQSFNKSSEVSTVQELKEHAFREEIKASVLQNQAKVEQELAIARRIDSAEEVEIEEYYDLSGHGSAGLLGNESGITFGLNGEGRKITKRVIKFKGCRPVQQNIQQTLEFNPCS